MSLSKVLGLFREVVVAQSFGAGIQTDAYLIASTIPLDIISSIMAAFSATFIPLFIQRYDRDESAGWEFASMVMNLLMLVSTSLVLVALVFAPQLVSLVTPGLAPDTARLAITLTRILMPVSILQALAVVLVGALQALGRFVWPALIGIPQNIVLILSVVLFRNSLGIEGMAYATVLGYVLQVLMLWTVLALAGYRHQWKLGLKHPGVRDLARLATPLLISTAVGHVALLVDRGFASYLPEGSIAALNWANLLYSLPVAIVGVGMVTTIYPDLVRSLEVGIDAFKKNLHNSMRLLIYLMTPMVVAVIWFRADIVRAVFQRGHFDNQATQATAFALLFYSSSILLLTFSEFLRRVYFGLRDSVTLMVNSVLMLLANIGLNYLLVAHLKQGGLALAYTLALLVADAMMLVGLSRKIGSLGLIKLVLPFVKSIIASVAAVVPLKVVFDYSFSISPRAGFIREITRVGLSLGLFCVLYLFLLYGVFRVPETGMLVSMVKVRFSTSSRRSS